MQEYKNKGLTLLKKGQKGIIHAIFSRFGLILLLQNYPGESHLLLYTPHREKERDRQTDRHTHRDTGACVPPQHTHTHTHTHTHMLKTIDVF